MTNKYDWLDKIIEEQEKIQGKAIIKLLNEVGEAVEKYGDAFFDPGGV